MKRLITLAPLFAGLLIATACGPPSLSLAVLEPAEFHVLDTTHLIIGESLGRPLAKELSAAALEDLIREDNYFSLVQNARIQRDALLEHEALLRLDVVEFFIHEDLENRILEDERGLEFTTQTPVLRAQVLLEISLMQKQASIMEKVLYEGIATFDLDGPDSSAIVRDSELYRAALYGALESFLNDITPRIQEHSIPLDDSDENLKEAVSNARARSFSKASKQFEEYLGQNPSASEAHYNIGVILDAQSRFEEAMLRYDEAIKLNPKPLYINTRSSCAERVYFRDSLL